MEDERDLQARRWQRSSEAMVDLVRRYGVRDARILQALRRVRRHVFVPAPYRLLADPYGDHPCPIGHGQTISQPFIVAYMTEKLALQPGDKALEIGIGSGYQAALLAEIGADVYSVEIVTALADHARRVLDQEGYGQVHIRRGNGYDGWPEHAPYDAVIVTCAPEFIPPRLVEQLSPDGRMIVPVGVGLQRLVLLRRQGDRIEEMQDLAVRFVPMVRGGE
jgi:protein-L-isoaspartate(D-aspartate) O-methyltransferase